MNKEMKEENVRIILASASPRRRELLGQIGIAYEVRVSDVEEKATAREPWLVVEELSAQKAEAVLEGMTGRKAEAALEGVAGRKAEAVLEGVTGRKAEAALEGMTGWKAEAALEGVAGRKAEEEPEVSGRNILVIGADTVVAVDGQILGKPSDKEDAVRMLEKLSGRCHDVYTGVTLLHWNGSEEAKQGGQLWRRVFHEVTKVHFYPMSAQEIASYVSSGDCMDKAGAYGIQGLCAKYIRCIEGDYNNVVGLPVARLYQEIKERIEIG